MKINLFKLLKKLIFVVVIVYIAMTLISQQKVLSSYEKNIASTKKEIEEATEYKKSLVKLKENAHTSEYIEKIAREKLNMYMPDEKVYIDIGN